MHRVELKVSPSDATGTFKIVVPNAPCGVERRAYAKAIASSTEFLMHRVELKEYVWKVYKSLLQSVPNAPCGVERKVDWCPQDVEGESS